MAPIANGFPKNGEDLGVLGGQWIFLVQPSRPTKNTFDNLWQASAAASLLKHVPAALGLRVAMGLVPLMRMSLRVPVDPAVAAAGTAEVRDGVTPSTELSKAG